METPVAYLAAPARYDSMVYRACGRSGLRLPVLSLGLWHNFGDTTPASTQREIVHTAFDAGITHIDLANNYGPPYGSAEVNFGRILREDLAGHRDELVISSKAGWDMWPGPYGQGGGSRKYVLASLDQSLRRVGVEYFDIFYSHRFDADTPLEETMGALAHAVRAGKALYVGISQYSAAQTREAWASRPTRRRRPSRPRRCWPPRAFPCSSISRRTTCWTAGSRVSSSTPLASWVSG
jgi:L-glyceraldehyde 3-phosphate reductase